jgi:serine/threonine protein kinase
MSDRDLVGRTLGEFILREQIGEGGYGAVYRGEQPLLERDVVVKVLHERRADDVSRRRFLREAKLASRLDHPYAAHIYAFGAEDADGLLWIAMELVQGVPLDDWLEARGPMPLEQFVPFFDCVAEVVHAAHERGIVHRDLKPSNIMVIERGGRLLPKLLDFGIAKVHSPQAAPPAPESEPDGGEVAPMRLPAQPSGSSVSERGLTPSGTCLGSQSYMAPEQWSNAEDVGPAADIYSLGIVAYEALTGCVPFTAKSTAEYFQLHCHKLPPMLLWPEVDRVVQTALAKYPNGRYRNMLEMASAMRRALRVSRREQLRSSAQQWDDQDRPPGLLWGPDVLDDVTRRIPPELLGELECSFVAASLRRARRIRWLWRTLVVLAAAIAIGGFQYEQQADLAEQQARLAEQQARLAEQQTRAARELAEARVTDSELEQGRAALLHGEPEALSHLTEAYKRDLSPTTAFMLAREMQPRLAEQARFTSTHGRMWWATFSPDGRQIATTDDRVARIWDGQTHQLLFTLSHGCEVYQAVYSPDGTRLVTAAQTTVRIWDAASGVLVRDLKAKPGSRAPSDYYLAAISSDGRLFAATDAAGSIVHVWDTRSGALVAELRNRAGEFPHLAFSPDGWLATTGGNEARVFDVQAWRQAGSSSHARW